jgi:hypothetical protein
MEWTIDYIKEDKIVCVKVSGRMDWEQHKKFAEEVFPFAIRNNSNKAFFDFWEMVPDFTVLQADDLPKLLKSFGIGPGFKIASLHDEATLRADEKRIHFLENVFSLSSIQLKHFFDKNEAMTWLKLPDQPKPTKSKP